MNNFVPDISVDYPDECILCYTRQPDFIAEIRGRYYFECSICRLVFLAPRQRFDQSAERAHYETHENDPADMAYRDFLSQLAEPLVKKLHTNACGLDYGSGPGPALSIMLHELGYATEIYDPFFAPECSVLNKKYDFIVCSETAEHFYAPSREFDLFDQLLLPGGWLGVMTQIRGLQQSLSEWHYVRDPTHVCFYALQTMNWIADYYDWTLHLYDNNVILFSKPSHEDQLVLKTDIKLNRLRGNSGPV